MNEVEKYLTLNYDVMGFNSPKKKVALVLTFMQGPEVEEWTRGILQWIQQIDDQSNMDHVWCIFLWRFYNWFMDTQSDSTAQKDLAQLKMRFPDIDLYISNFKQTVRKALYCLGSHEMNQQFLSGLPWDIAEDIMCYPTPIMYQEYSQKALASVQSKVLLRNIFGGGNRCWNQNASRGARWHTRRGTRTSTRGSHGWPGAGARGRGHAWGEYRWHGHWLDRYGRVHVELLKCYSDCTIHLS